MATTSGNAAVGTAGGWRGNGRAGRYGRKANVAMGLAILACAATLGFSGLRLRGAALPGPAASAAVVSASGHSVLSPLGRTGPSDEYLQADLANAFPIVQRTGPADEYDR